MRAFEWTEPRVRAIEPVTRRRSTLEEIAAEVGVCRKTLYNWRHRPEFAARVDATLAEYAAEMRREVLAEVRRRAVEFFRRAPPRATRWRRKVTGSARNGT